MLHSANSVALRLLLAVLLLLGSTAAAGAEPEDHRFYIGGGSTEGVLEDANASCDTTTVDCEGEGFKAFFGYQFNRHATLEGGYMSVNDLVTEMPDPTHEQVFREGEVREVREVRKFSTFYLANALRLPLGEVLALTARIGMHKWTSDLCIYDRLATDENLPAQCEKNNEVDPLYGLGIDLDITRHLRLQAHYTRYEGGSDDLDVTAASLAILF